MFVGQSVNLSAAVMSGSNVTYRWDFGDGNSGTGAQVSHTYAAPGQYTVIIIASNDTSSVVQEIQVSVAYGLHIPRLSR